ncbi:DUF1173 domain-containing protein [Hydrogenophaga sp.]|uniref:DUF1173 domain-containing protein n=1 Tax=Hydrogenophaga sp. TaxID=1904254 RepID=UPI0008CD0A83|nr:DUF1173 domain-containing protein [Hydrogenophaga sp.]OGA73893.1 MAG: hypothetical protein A2X73_23910 [Burkholderiales bacterium GWE1_65_30]OGA91767.1 MAG: hypothetical protein A2X72_07765 [Burkholderiales bacterium GWF1_66_17]
MEATAETVPAYEIGGQRWDRTMPDFSEAIAKAHAHHLRPRCLCRVGTPTVEMYVARLSDGYVIKRMPSTGWQHATDCPSYEPPAEFSGLGQLVGSAIVENPVTGVTALRLGFPMSKLPGRHVQPAAGSASSSVAAQGQKLGLRALLHYLWDQAELTHWKPGFAGRRHWATVRRHLLQAAENKTTHGQPLQASLYIPEVFSVEQRDAIQTRRQRLWARSAPRHDQPQPLLLMVAEVKEIAPTRYGHKAIIKHLPDQAFALDDALYRRLGRGFERELTLWGMEPDLHLLMIATIRVDEAGTPCIVEISVMLTTSQWLPVDDGWDRQLVEALVRQGRSFVKGLRYNTPGDQALVCASLLDCGATPCPLFIDREHSAEVEMLIDFFGPMPDPGEPIWRWNPTLGDMHALPLPFPLADQGHSTSDTGKFPDTKITQPP